MSEMIINQTEAQPVNRPDPAAVEKAIRQNALGAMASCFIPNKIANMAAVTAINLNMARMLSKLYGVEFRHDIATKLIVSAAGMGGTMVFTPLVEDLLFKIVPVYNVQAMVCSVPVMFGGVTYAVGKMFVNHFERGGSFADANIDVMKQSFKAAYKNSRQWLGNAVAGKKAVEDAGA